MRKTHSFGTRKVFKQAIASDATYLSINFNKFLEIARVGEGKKIYLLEYVTEEQLIVVLSGKQRHVRLVPVRALDGDEVEWIKVAETKGCITLTTGVVRRNPLNYCLCVAIKKQVRRVIIHVMYIM